MSPLSPDLIGALDVALRNLLSWSLQLGLVAWAAAIVTQILPVERPGARLRLWQVLLAGGLVLPMLQPWRSAVAGVDWSLGLASSALAPSTALAEVPAQASAPLPWALIVAAVLLGGASVQLGRLALGLARLRVIRRTARVLDTPSWLDNLRARTVPTARFVTSDHCCGPATFGALHPTIVLPPAFNAMPRERQHAVALHELIHARRRDWLVLVGEELVKALLFFHPAVHWLVGRIRLAREQCVDGEVVRSLGGRQAYLESLVEVARLSAGAEAVPAAPFLRERHLRERVELLMKEVPMSHVRSLIHVALTAGALVLAGAVAAAAFPMLGPPVPGAASPASEEPATEKFEPKIVHKVTPSYPKGAKEDRAQGIVLIEVTIDTAGQVSDARVIVSTPSIDYSEGLLERRGTPGAVTADERLAAAALEAVRQWRYEPVLDEHGQPKPVDLVLTIKFALS